MARAEGASVIVVEQNHDIGGHAMVSGGRIPLGGGTRLQKKFGIVDSADQVYLDHTDFHNLELRYSDHELVRVWADENAATFDFLLDNGVQFEEVMPTLVNEGTVPRLFRTKVYSDDLKVTINGSPGSGLVRALEKSARAKGVEILLRHSLTRIVRDNPSQRVQGITATVEGKQVNVEARRGFIIATGGFTSNVAFRRMFDPRLTEEYQVAGEPWSKQNADGEMLALALGASLWGTSNVASEHGRSVTKTRHIGARYGYENLRWNPGSPMFPQVGGAGLTVKSYQDLICVNQFGKRFWNELDDTLRIPQRVPRQTRSGCEEQEVERRRSHLGDLRCGRGQTRRVGSEASERRSERLFLHCRHARRARAQDRQSLSDGADAGAHPRGDHRQIQLVRRCGQGSGVRQARPDVQDSEAAVLRGLGDARFCTTRSPVFASTDAAKCSTSAGR